MNRIFRKASKKPPKSISLLDKASDKFTAQIAREYRDAIKELERVFGSERVLNLLAKRDINGIVALINSIETDERLLALRAKISEATQEGGKIAADLQTPVTGASGQRVSFVFDFANPKIPAFASRITAARVSEIGRDMKIVLRETIRDSILRGENPLTTARQIRQSIGLTSYQTRIVQNFRRELETGRLGAAMTRTLRDRRFDPLLERTLRDQLDLTPEKIDQLVNRYRERLLKLRTQTIARTEATRALQGGQQLFVEQQVEEGRIDEKQVRRFWITAQDEKVRSSHRAIPRLNPDGVRMKQQFKTPLGPLMFPGDPAGSAGNTINCRCTVFVRILSKELAEEQAA